jgi:hypothetical protein
MFNNEYERLVIMPYETVEFLKRRFGYKEVNCLGPDMDNRLCIKVTYDSHVWKELLVTYKDIKSIEGEFIRAFNMNSWDGTYIQECNTTLVKEIFAASTLSECGYWLNRNVLYKREKEYEEIVDLSEVYSLQCETVVEDGYDEIVLKLATYKGIYEIREDGYTFTEKNLRNSAS